MKRKICFLLIALLLLPAVLISCGGETTGNTNNKGKDYVFVSGGITFSLDSDFAPIAGALGTPKTYDESESCGLGELAKVWGYEGFEVETYTDGDLDRIYSVSLIDDSVATPEGIRIGSDAGEVDTAYGTDYKASGENRKYEGTKSDLLITMRGGSVTGITYSHR